MKMGCVLLVFLLSVAQAAHSSESLVLEPLAGALRLRLAQQPVAPVVGTRYQLNLVSSQDLKTWAPVGELQPDASGSAQLTLANSPAYQFFQIHPELLDSGQEEDGADVFGYNRIFQEELRAAAFLSPEDFAVGHEPSRAFWYTSGLSFDPTQAEFWGAFSADPAVYNAALPPDSPERRLYDFRLNPAEVALFKTNGFVVSERLGSYSFADCFYRVFADDLPVFVSADAILHAWHFSYQRLLEEAEETQLAPALQQVLDSMHRQLGGSSTAVRDGPMKDSLRDADYYLAVVRSLLSGQRVTTVLQQSDLDTAVAKTLEAVAQLQFVLEFPIFGTNRMVDFSQFKVRGHYERNPVLGRYFQAFMWTARTDLRVFQAQPSPQSLRELGTAVVLSELLKASGNAELWQQLDGIIRLFVGRTDALTFGQLQPLIESFGIQNLESLVRADQLEQLQNAIVQGQLGLQVIPADAYITPFGPEQLQLPRAFVLTGQRFNPDGWALSQVIFDRILWDQEIPGFTFHGKVVRRFGSALDAAYAVLGNRQVGWEIAQRMLDTANRSSLRDGLPYAHNLAALAATFDRMAPAAWEDSITTRWLAALRELSTPTTHARYPEAMRTRAWAMRTLNTQLASYTELKHDTVLYAKQPYTGMITCEYPAGFVEPVPAFWRKLREMADAAAAGLEALRTSGIVTVTNPDPSAYPGELTVDLAVRQAARVAFCRTFAERMAVLETMAMKELQQVPFSDGEMLFIRSLMNRQDHLYFGPTFDGWYPGLFYKDYGQLDSRGEDPNGSNKADSLVTDIQTAPPDEFDPIGGVLHEATGNVDMLMIAVDSGPDRMVYAGPVMSHYEFIIPGPVLTRLSDSEWQERVPSYPWQAAVTPPPRPDWTRSYLVPK